RFALLAGTESSWSTRSSASTATPWRASFTRARTTCKRTSLRAGSDSSRSLDLHSVLLGPNLHTRFVTSKQLQRQAVHGDFDLFVRDVHVAEGCIVHVGKGTVAVQPTRVCARQCNPSAVEQSR